LENFFGSGSFGNDEENSLFDGIFFKEIWQNLFMFGILSFQRLFIKNWKLQVSNPFNVSRLNIALL
jgi:hypothetical protein